MTNPGNAVGTNAAYGGRTSVNAFNDNLSAYSRGVLSGWACAPDSGLTVVLGGDGNTRDVAVAEDNSGNKTTINNISGSPISVTIGAAPGANTRIDSIVAYVDASPQGTPTIVDNYEACGLIVVQGTASSSPVAPTDNAIRAAITADGASGATAYYVVLANITMANGTTDITAGEINTGPDAVLQERNINIPIFTKAVSSHGAITVGVTPSTVLSLSVGEDGEYYIEGIAGLFGAGTSYGGIYIYKNSTEIAKNYSPEYGNRIGLALGTVVSLSVGDTVSLMLSVGSATASNSDREYSLFITKIS